MRSGGGERRRGRRQGITARTSRGYSYGCVNVLKTEGDKQFMIALFCPFCSFFRLVEGNNKNMYFDLT
eukprot:747803-Hanusia_phi.AAC.2